MQTEKEQFRNYLKKTGIIDSLTRVFTTLYETQEKPQDPTDWLKSNLGQIIGVDIIALEKENEELKEKVKELNKLIKEQEKKEETSETNEIKE